MNIVQKLTTAHLKANVRRTVTTVLGIVISVAMITAVFVSVSSLFNYSAMLQYITAETGMQAVR